MTENATTATRLQPLVRPSRLVLLQEMEFVGQPHRGGRPIHIVLPIGAVGVWHEGCHCFTFFEHRRRGWNPWFWWEELEKQPEKWKTVE